MGGCTVKKIFFLKFNQIWCVSYLYEWRMHRHNFLGPHPLGPRGGAKRSHIIKIEIQSQFQRFLNQTLCIFSQMKDITYQTEFSFGRLGHAQGWDLVVWWGGGGQIVFFPKFNQIWCVSYLHELHMHRHNFWGPQPLGPCGGVKNLIF